MDKVLQLGYSPCPNDTFIFYGLAEGAIDTSPYRFDITLADVEALNQRARLQALDITKVSIHAILHLLENYWLLGAGGAIGRGCGPLVVAREKLTMEELRDRPMAIPGRLTTANLLLQLTSMHRGPLIEMCFDQIMPAIAEGRVDAGVIIHEGRFTYPLLGLNLVLDLGAWWEGETGFPLPLGGIIMKRDLGSETARLVEDKIRESLRFAWKNSDAAWPYIREHAQEMEPDVIRSHIDMFVNDFSLNVGDEGERAVRFMLEAAARQEGLTLPDKPIFRA
ncbi:MAG: 1,4-dihydroxy-6-naphthoate synthase [Acidobacteriota bacterium]